MPTKAEKIAAKAEKRRTKALQHLAEKGWIDELRDQPLEVTRELIEHGWAEVTGKWNEVVNGKRWLCQRVKFTDAGRAEWQRRQAS